MENIIVFNIKVSSYGRTEGAIKHIRCWINALRSEQYIQCHESLCEDFSLISGLSKMEKWAKTSPDSGHCCLSVKEHIRGYHPENWNIIHQDYFADDNLPHLKEFDLIKIDGSSQLCDYFVKANDKAGMTFAEIADAIEEVYRRDGIELFPKGK